MRPVERRLAAGDDLVFTWRTLALGYSFVSSASLGPTAVWMQVNATPIAEGNLNKVVVPRPSAATFYRLRK